MTQAEQTERLLGCMVDELQKSSSMHGGEAEAYCEGIFYARATMGVNFRIYSEIQARLAVKSVLDWVRLQQV
jgi:putative component of toxin-antitoxin plasmid stabilization module